MGEIDILVIDYASMRKLCNYSFSDKWFIPINIKNIDDERVYHFEVDSSEEFKRVELDGICYLLDPKNVDNDNINLLLIKTSGNDSIFSRSQKNQLSLDRLIKTARSYFSSHISIPINWHPYREQGIVSIYLGSKNIHRAARAHFYVPPFLGPRDVFAFCKTDNIVSFSDLPDYTHLYARARGLLTDAILKDPPRHEENNHSTDIILSKRLPQGYKDKLTLDEWYSLLTKDQCIFVDLPNSQPVRLRGAAGTGKTIAMVVKFLRDAYKLRAAGSKWRAVYLTHSQTTADLVTSLLENLDTDGLLYDSECSVHLEVRTLHDLANELLQNKNIDFEPLALDGWEGRTLQMELIQEIIKDLLNDARFVDRFLKVASTSIQKGFRQTVSGGDTFFVSEVMNEFACKLDGEFIRFGTDKAGDYKKERRPKWLMKLPKIEDREVLLILHRDYRKILKELKVISVDQMTADLKLFLGSNIWEQISDDVGYDALFVDEVHIFSHIERYVLHRLIRIQEGIQKTGWRPPIFMAFDLKQNPNDTIAHIMDREHNQRWWSANLENAEVVNLETIFRYTPQITKLVKAIDNKFPALAIGDDWDEYKKIHSQVEDGKKPELWLFDNEKAMINKVFAEARTKARETRGRDVAVLVASEALFDQFQLVAKADYANGHLLVSERSPSSMLRHAGKRFVLSRPEYVAGLQFSTVYLTNVDLREAPINAELSIRRRFISNVYLGVSRAEKEVILTSCENRGGISDILDIAISNKVISVSVK